MHGTSAASVLAQPVKEPAPPLVLVVDDSVTTRTLERSILEAHGYRVEMAVDGRDALERMARRPPDLVVSDIEMPRLDGFGLLAAIRGEPRWARLPVVLVSSRGAAADRERGMSLGADAYIVKTRFDQDELLRVVGRLT
ncbi:MAG: response regulator [Magnetospirillum sp.]|nr:response regulator [Magnetospirillum sp.]